jgi:ubiquinone/menaquinone biosynthesis C-methylase UbiE
VLKKNGKVTILEFRLPEKRFLKFVTTPISNIYYGSGGIISRDYEAYKYLRNR